LSEKSIEVVVLAAGQGTRMKSTLPKVLHPLAGTSMLAHVLNAARTVKPERIHVVYGHGGEVVRAAVDSPDVSFAEQAQQLGTGHAARMAMPSVRDASTVLILFGDVPMVSPHTIRQALDAAAQDALAVVTVMLDDPHGYGRIIRGADGRMIDIREQKDASLAEQAIDEINTGIMAAPAARLRAWLDALSNNNAQREYYLTDAVTAAVSESVAVETVLAHDEYEVAGINDRVQLARLEREYQRRQAEALMRAGVSLADPARIDIRGAVQIGPDVSIDVNVVLEGEVSIGSGSRIGPNCMITDSAIGEHVEVLANCVIDSATISRGARVGPFARVRPQAELGEDVHVGNFVEIKKSRLAKGAKVNHLTYVGDADIGARVNVGAGTITCNYDGVNKHRTVIGEDAFIGSGSMLVAPLSIGANATIGAGSTIGRDAPAGELTLERAKQRSIPGWQRPTKKS
jgi:bifunctional UDP-N-acetylglucosamine pyrophosphorylase / glucosamine-1-phosphate N-acetyltransferase